MGAYARVRVAGGGRIRLMSGHVKAIRRFTVRSVLPEPLAPVEDLRAYMDAPRWYQTLSNAPGSIAYFSPEYGITAALPQYSGGLGILAGDHLKAASDLGVPLIGVGLLYRHGYFRQTLSRDGWQQEHYPVLDPNELPLTPLKEEDGSPAFVAIALPGGRSVRARIWLAQVGR